MNIVFIILGVSVFQVLAVSCFILSTQDNIEYHFDSKKDIIVSLFVPFPIILTIKIIKIIKNSNLK
jgi:hypothetical protein